MIRASAGRALLATKYDVAGWQMNVVAKFGVALRSLADTALGVPELLPSRLAVAAVAALDGVDAAGISLFTDELRVPIGTSDTAAAVAQALQFSVGDGPCFAAHHDQKTVVADQHVLAGGGRRSRGT